ncbi:MAG: hypothetical protein HY826_00145 [Actinobacteria bacterium]|nr:hypothetical protein [Actinomycetota bacterium]
MRRSRIVFSSLALLAAVSACADAGATQERPSTTISPGSAAAPAALQFSAPSVGGGTIDFTQFAGQTVALWFWAPT